MAKCQSTGIGKKLNIENRNSAATGEASVENQLIWELLRTKNTDSAFGKEAAFHTASQSRCGGRRASPRLVHPWTPVRADRRHQNHHFWQKSSFPSSEQNP